MKKFLNWLIDIDFMDFVGLMFKVGLAMLIVFLGVVVIKGLKDDRIMLNEFEVPQNLELAGYKGKVLSRQLQDKLTTLKIEARSSKEDSLHIEFDQTPDLNFQILGVGLSSQSLSYHLKRLMGIESKTISGELIDIDDKLKITLRMTNRIPISFEEHYEMGHIDKSLESLLELTAREILRYSDPYLLVLLKLRKGELDQAENLVREMIEQESKDLDYAYNAWGNIKGRRGDKEGAIKMFEKSLDHNPNFDLPLRSLGWHHFRNEDYEKALTMFERSIDSGTNNFGSYNGKAKSFEKLGMTDKAERSYQASIDKFPNLLWSHAGYWQFLVNVKKDTSAAFEVWKNAESSLKKNADYYVAQSAKFILTMDIDSLLHYTNLALDYNPNHVEALQMKLGLLPELNLDYPESDSLCKRFVELLVKGNYDGGMVQGGYNRWAMNDYRFGKFDSALVHIHKAIDIFPDNPFPWSTLAETYALMGDDARFYQFLDSALIRGLEIKNFLKDEPYNKYVGTPTFEEFLKKKKNTGRLKN